MRKRQGFTLIEVLGAIVLLSVAIVPVMGLIRNALIITQKQERNMKSLYLAKLKMEEVIALVRNNFSGDTDAANKDFYYDDGLDEEFEHYKYTVIDDNASGLKTITVKTGYDEDDDNILDTGEIAVTLNIEQANRD